MEVGVVIQVGSNGDILSYCVDTNMVVIDGLAEAYRNVPADGTVPARVFTGVAEMRWIGR